MFINDDYTPSAGASALCLIEYRLDINSFMTTIIERITTALKQESTWRGIIAILTAAGVTISPELSGYIIAIGLTLIGGINIVKTD
jgi:hypothetical protein